MSALSWLLVGMSLNTPVTVSAIGSVEQLVTSRRQGGGLTVMIRPTGSASPKYLRAMAWDSTTDCGWARTWAGSPVTIGRCRTLMKLGSTDRTVSANCFEPTVKVMYSVFRRVASITSGISSCMVDASIQGVVPKSCGGRPGACTVFSSR